MSEPFHFKEGSKFLISSAPKTSSSQKINRRYHSEQLSPNQKNFTSINPVKPYKRISPIKIADTGINPEQTFIDFIKKDFQKPYIKPNLKLEKFTPTNPLKWSLGYTYKCNDINLIPKFSNFKEYYFSKNTNEEILNYQNNYLNTDNISIRPRIINKSYNDNSFVNLKQKFGPFSESKNCWIPKHYINGTVANKNSVSYNIINNLDYNFSGKKGNDLFDKKINNRKKGISEFEDIKNPSNPKFTQEFNELISNNNKIFYNVKGPFTHLYDSSAQNGNIYLPFKREKN